LECEDAVLQEDDTKQPGVFRITLTVELLYYIRLNQVIWGAINYDMCMYANISAVYTFYDFLYVLFSIHYQFVTTVLHTCSPR